MASPPRRSSSSITRCSLGGLRGCAGDGGRNVLTDRAEYDAAGLLHPPFLLGIKGTAQVTRIKGTAQVTRRKNDTRGGRPRVVVMNEHTLRTDLAPYTPPCRPLHTGHTGGLPRPLPSQHVSWVLTLFVEHPVRSELRVGGPAGGEGQAAEQARATRRTSTWPVRN